LVKGNPSALMAEAEGWFMGDWVDSTCPRRSAGPSNSRYGWAWDVAAVCSNRDKDGNERFPCSEIGCWLPRETEDDCGDLLGRCMKQETKKS
jgi:hypothetical protein